jgi:Fungal specific transcription factor domain/Fungal Zn(2)-Cys(6) binuclear cluster domain
MDNVHRIREAANTAPKEISPSDDGSGPNTPRKRVSQACDRCRSRKDKCDGVRPVCSTCAALDQVCSYHPPTRKRGLPEGYVRGIEKLWGLTIREAEGIEKTVLAILAGGGDDNGLEVLSKIWNDRDSSETLLETWRKSRISRELEKLLPILDSAEEKSSKRKRMEIGPWQAAESSIYTTNPASPISPEQKLSIQAPQTPLDGLYRLSKSPNTQGRHQDTSGFSVERIEVGITAPDLPSKAWHLLDVYFSYTHSWLPIAERHDLLRTSYQYSHNGANVSCSLPGSGDHAALWAILAYADYQRDVVKKSSSVETDGWNVDSLYAHARGLIPNEDGVFEMGHVQALLVLTLLNMGLGRWSRAWILVGQAVRIAVDIGLDEGQNADLAAPKLVDKRSRSKHVFLGCFALDTLIAARLHRIPHLRKEDADRVGFLEEDGLDEWNPWIDTLGVRRGTTEGPRGPVSVLSTFNRFIKLLKILNSVLCNVSTGMRRVECCQGLMNELSSWGQALPSQFAPAFTSREKPGPSLLPHHYHLHMAHISIISILYAHLSPSCTEIQMSDSTITETFATTARQACWLLMRQYETFGLLIIPPTFEYFMKVACEGSYKSQRQIADAHITYDEWKQNMQKFLDGMLEVWPAFLNVKDAFFTKTAIGSHRSPKSTEPSASQTASFNEPQRFPTHTKQLLVNDGTLSLNERSIGTLVPAMESPLGYSNSDFSTRRSTSSFNVSGPGGFRNLGGGPWHSRGPGQSLIDPAITGHLPIHHGSLSSDIDGDSMFNEFATLDAMEWCIF